MILALIATALAGPPAFEGTLGVKSNPAGLGLFGNVYWDAADTKAANLDVGPGLAVYFFWYELQAASRITLLEGFLVGSVQAAAEPGAFLRDDDRDAGRQFMLRPLGRARLELNVRNDLLWLYSRSTGWSRYRTWDEYDPFRDTSFRTGFELSGEQSVALMTSPSGGAERKVWFYVETTLEASVGPGWLDQMVRGGVILEKLTPSLSMDLDLYYSFMDTAVGGPGALVVLWWLPRREEQ